VLVAVLAELVLIAAGNNQWVTRYVFDHVGGTQNSLQLRLADAATTYSWRVSKPGQDAGHNWLGQWVLIGTVLLITALLVFAVARGVVSFGRVFFGTWTAVIVATEVGAIVRGLVLDDRVYGFTNRASFAFFGQASPSGYNFLGGVGLGLLVGLVAAVAAVATRRTAGVMIAPPAPAPVPEPTEGAPPRQQMGAPPWFGQRQATAAPITEPAREERPNLSKGESGDFSTGTGRHELAPTSTDAAIEQPPVGANPTDSAGHESAGQPTEQLPAAAEDPGASASRPTDHRLPAAAEDPGASAGEPTEQLPPVAAEDPGASAGEPTEQLPPVAAEDPGASASQGSPTQRTSQFPPVAD